MITRLLNFIWVIIAGFNCAVRANTPNDSQNEQNLEQQETIQFIKHHGPESGYITGKNIQAKEVDEVLYATIDEITDRMWINTSELRIEDIKHNSKALTAFFKVLTPENFPALKRLIFSNVNIRPKDIAYFVSAGVFTTLTELSFENCALSSKSIESIVSAINSEQFPNLESASFLG